MGQAYSHWNSSERQRQAEQAGRPQASSMRTGSTPRAQSTAFRGTGTSDVQRLQRSRFSPYTTGSPRITSRRSEPPPATSIAAAAAAAEADQGEPAAAAAPDAGAGTEPSDQTDMDILAAAAQAADAEDVDMGAAQMDDAGAAAASASDGAGWRHSRSRVRAGNELLSRIVSRSVVNSIAQELDRRNRVLREEQQSSNTESELPSGVTQFQLDIGGGLDLYLNILMFILAVLESDLEDGVSENEEATDGVRVAAGGSADATAGSTQRHSTQDDDMETAAGAGAGGAEERPQSTPTSVLESTNPGMQFRMFLLPGAIEQALDHYARENGAGSGETARAEASAVGNSVGAAEQEQGQPDPSSSAPSENDLTEHVEEVFMDEPGDDADAIDRLLLGHAAGTSRPSSSPEHGGAQHAREQTSDEARRAEAQRLREEKFQRLRNIAQAMNDERRTIAIPMVLLGLRINSELRRTTRMALRDAANASDAPQQQQQQQEQEQQRVESAAAAQPIGGLHGALRGLRDRLSGIVPSLFSSSGSAGLHGAQSSGQSDAAEPDSRVHGSRSEAGVAAGEAGAGAGAGDGFAEAATSATAAPNESNQPGLSVFITIRYMQLGNPAILPMVTYSMFPELFSSSPTSSNVHTNLTASNYDLFIEISNIIGQARASTVSQDVIDKRMKKYQYECGRSGGVATARVAGAGAGVDEVVKLVSAERCPVCLEEFAEGDDLRVLTCCHALHLSCGDAWFTQGSNMCPICRQPAIQIGSNKS